jgi:hypothetical protein
MNNTNSTLFNSSKLNFIHIKQQEANANNLTTFTFKSKQEIIAFLLNEQLLLSKSLLNDDNNNDKSFCICNNKEFYNNNNNKSENTFNYQSSSGLVKLSFLTLSFFIGIIALILILTLFVKLVL